MNRIDIQLLQTVLDDLNAALPTLHKALVDDWPEITAICRLVHAQSLLGGLIAIETKEAA